MFRRCLFLLATALWLLSPANAAELHFVREGLRVTGLGLSHAANFQVNGTPVPASRLPDDEGWLLEDTWVPRRLVHVRWLGATPGEATATAPLRPAPWVRMRVSWPPADWLSTGPADVATTLAFSPDASLLAAGSQQGRVTVLAAADGSVRWAFQRPGRVIKQLAFDADAGRLYVGEQGPEGRLAAYAPGTDAPLWTLDTAGNLGRTPLADARDPYAWVTQPGAYRVMAVGSDVLAAFSRSWNAGGSRHGRSRLYRVDGATGAVRWAYPAAGAQSGVLTWFALDEVGNRVLMPVQSPMGADAADTRPSRVVVLDLATGHEIAQAQIGALAPYPVAGLWRGLGLQSGGDALAVTTDDGRAFFWRRSGDGLVPIATERLVTPVKLGGVTVTATSGTLAATAQGVVFATGPTYVPPEFGGGGEPTVNHPDGNSLFARNWRGQAQWVWRLDNDLQNVATNSAGRWLAVTEGGEGAQPAGAFQGLALLDLRAAAAGRVVYRLPLEGRPVFGTLAVSADGRWLALAETPRRIVGEARPQGVNRLLVVR